MPTILSRFDMIYIIKDEHDEQKDTVSQLILYIQKKFIVLELNT